MYNFAKNKTIMKPILQKSKTIENSYVLTDKENGIVITFEAGNFNDTKKITFLNDLETPDAVEIAKMLRIMADWLAENHPEIIARRKHLYFYAKNSKRLYLVEDLGGGKLFVSLDGQTSIPNAGIFIKNLGGVESLKAKCFSDPRSLIEIRTEILEKQKAAKEAAKNRAKIKAAEKEKASCERLKALLECSPNGVLKATEENIRVLARYLSATNYGLWNLPPMSVGYSANQYENGCVTIKFDSPIIFEGQKETRLAFGAKANELKTYTHVRF